MELSLNEYFDSVSSKPCDQIWRNFATLAFFELFGQSIRVYLVFNKILNLLWQFFPIGQIFIANIEQIIYSSGHTVMLPSFLSLSFLTIVIELYRLLCLSWCLSLLRECVVNFSWEFAKIQQKSNFDASFHVAVFQRVSVYVSNPYLENSKWNLCTCVWLDDHGCVPRYVHLCVIGWPWMCT